MSILNLEKLVAPISEEQPCGLSKETSENLDLEAAFGLVQFAADIARKIEKAKAELELLAPAVRKDVIKDSAGRSNDPKKIRVGRLSRLSAARFWNRNQKILAFWLG